MPSREQIMHTIEEELAWVGHFDPVRAGTLREMLAELEEAAFTRGQNSILEDY